MNFKQYLTESIWTKSKADEFLSMMEPTFKKAHIKVEITGSVKTKGESENDLDLHVIKHSATSFNHLVKLLKEHPEVVKVMNYEEPDINHGDIITILLKPDRRVVDIIFG